ncbi:MULTISPECIES: exonuclease domain-containing protein [Streptomyces]|uniref:exonuclease domain-containing protein n=1 Tax=Streptomyces TaxID=1883 RepID=UPI001679AB86|nr:MULTISPECIES: exonuclease domain-containing protein [Streptomyces]MBK3524870.1 DNA polymerase III subunit epsilon [Streptomyces sp. MBT70]GGR70810.1 3'-5' exonuclease [Streptomyces eurythermus]
MTSFATVRRAAWDTETTGPDPLTDRIVTAAFIVRGGGREDRIFSWLINPGVPIPPEASEVHGITDAMVQAAGQDPKTALDEIATNLVRAIEWGMPVVAFNHSFDWSILHHDLVRHGLPTVEERVGLHPLPLLDPHVIDKQVDKYVKGSGQRKLKPTAERYGVQLENWHTAEADALAALLIAEAQFERYPHLSTMSPAQLFTAQQAWRAAQQASLQQWFRTRATPEQGGDPNKVIDGSWPLIPAQRAGGEA